MWKTTNRIMRFAAQWWMLRMSHPKLMSLMIEMTLSYATSGEGL